MTPAVIGVADIVITQYHLPFMTIQPTALTYFKNVYLTKENSNTMKRLLKQSLKLFTLIMATVIASTLSISTAQAQGLTVVGSTLNSKFSNESSTFAGVSFKGNSFNESTTGTEIRLEGNSNLGTLTLETSGNSDGDQGFFTLEILFSLPSGFSANPVIATGEVFGFENFAFIDFGVNTFPVGFNGPNGAGVFLLNVDDVCLSRPSSETGFDPCSSEFAGFGREISGFRRDSRLHRALKSATSPPSNVAQGAGGQEPAVFTLTLTATITIEEPITPPTSTGGLPAGCVRNLAYYQRTPSAIPTDPNFSLNLGAKNYTRDELLAILAAPVQVNGLTRLAQQLIAIKLNVGAGTAPPEILKAIADADALIDNQVVRPIGQGFLSLNMVNRLYIPITRFNDGKIAGAPRCR